MNKWFKIKLVDKFLIFIMFVLLAYTIITIYIPKSDSQIIGSIDTVVRTTIASIFGYFISSNFIKNESNKYPSILDTNASVYTAKTNDIKIRNDETLNKIGFETINEEWVCNHDNIIGSAEVKNNNMPNSNTNELQILIVGSICIVSIFAILFTRFFVNIILTDVAGLSQLRDIICGSIGFLIGMPTNTD